MNARTVAPPPRSLVERRCTEFGTIGTGACKGSLAFIVSSILCACASANAEGMEQSIGVRGESQRLAQASSSMSSSIDEKLRREVSIPAGSLAAALEQLAKQTGADLVYRPDQVAGLTTAGVKGEVTTEVAIARLLEGTPLKVSTSAAGAYLISVPKVTASSSYSGREINRETRIHLTSVNDAASASEEQSSEPESTIKIDSKAIPEILVTGTRSLNVDIERTEDDPLPYVVIDRATIEKSGASDLNDFLMTRVSMSATGRTAAQGLVGNGNTSSVNLRGLGETQTLILIDGRRAAKTSLGGSSGQPDINGIPLSAIERIEILPTTASAIYGGSATGGVVNVILRRDYEGIETSVTYDNSFDGDSASKRIDLAGGTSLFEGRTTVFVAASYAESNALRVNERDFVQQGRQKIFQNFPGFLTTPFSSTSANVRSANGTNLVLDNGTALNSPYTFAPVGYAGRALDDGAALLANAGAYNMSLSNAAAMSQNSSAAGGSVGGDFSLWGGNPPQKYLSGSIRHEFNDSIKVFFEASHSNNDTRQGGAGVNLPGSNISANAPSNPFGQNINVAWSTRQLSGYTQTESTYNRYSGGAIVRLPRSWNASLDYTFSDSQLSMRDTTPYFGDGAALYAAIDAGLIDVLRDFDSQGIDPRNYVLSNFTRSRDPLEVTTKNPALRLSGPIGELPGGRPQLSLLLERQDTEFGQTIDFLNGGSYGVLYPERTQKTDSAYLELRAPLISSSNRWSWLRELELQIAARWDQYESKNAGRANYAPPAAVPSPVYVRSKKQEVSPLVALRMKPVDSLALRASFGEGYLPPDINQLAASELIPQLDAALLNVLDPKRGNTLATGLIDLAQQGNPNLVPETSRTFSAGFIAEPSWIDGLRVSVDYTQIKKRNAIIFPNEQQILEVEEQFPGRVVRGPNLPTDPAGWAGPITFIDISMLNLAKLVSESYDFQVDYGLDVANLGRFAFFASATYQDRLDLKASPATATVDNVGWSSGDKVLEWRGNAGVQWTKNNWSAGWNMRYSDSYYVANPASSSSISRFRAQGNGGLVPSQTYHDLSFGHEFATAENGTGIGSLLDGLQLQAGVRNVFNKKPPYDVSASYYYYSGLGDPRLATYYVTLRKRF